MTFDRSRWRACIPVASSGRFFIRRAEINEKTLALGLLRGVLDDMGRTVTMLIREDLIPGYETADMDADPSGFTVVMSDAAVEVEESRWVWENARGRVLINGLGLGLTVRMALDRPEVTRVDVVELHPDVARLVLPSLPEDPRLCLYLGNAYGMTWEPGDRWDVAWHDIWDYPDGEKTREGVEQLRRMYDGRAAVQNDWPACVRSLGLEEAVALAKGAA